MPESRIAHAIVDPNITYLTGGLGVATLTFPVRVIKDSDIVRDGDLNPDLRRNLRSEEWDMLRALSLLFRAEEVQDSKAAKDAYELSSPVLFGHPQNARDRDTVELAISMLSLPANLGSDLDMLISHAFAKARLVCWNWKLSTAESDARRPLAERRAIGIYCSDYQTAIAAKMILGSVRICFRCNKPFIAKRPKQNCCKVECREAHRLARWRAKKKSELHIRQKAPSPRLRKSGASARYPLRQQR
jgi:hypothetical protein